MQGTATKCTLAETSKAGARGISSSHDHQIVPLSKQRPPKTSPPLTPSSQAQKQSLFTPSPSHHPNRLRHPEYSPHIRPPDRLPTKEPHRPGYSPRLAHRQAHLIYPAPGIIVSSTSPPQEPPAHRSHTPSSVSHWIPVALPYETIPTQLAGIRVQRQAPRESTSGKAAQARGRDA